MFLADVARGIGGAAVHLGRVLAGEGAAAVAGVAAVGIHDDLAAGQAAVPRGPPMTKAAGGVDVNLGLVVQQPGGDLRADDPVNADRRGMV